jgi:hypothetical protein
MEHYARAREETVLPLMLRPRALHFLWCMMGLVAVSGLLAFQVSVPTLASGTAIVADASFVPCQAAGVACLVVVLPADQLSDVEVGQRLFIRLDNRTRRLETVVTAVEGEVWSPRRIRDETSLESVERPAVVLYAAFEPEPEAAFLLEHSYQGSTFDTEVEVGSRNLASLLSGLISSTSGASALDRQRLASPK